MIDVGLPPREVRLMTLREIHAAVQYWNRTRAGGHSDV